MKKIPYFDINDFRIIINCFLGATSVGIYQLVTINTIHNIKRDYNKQYIKSLETQIEDLKNELTEKNKETILYKTFI